VAHIWSVLEREKTQLDRIRFLSLPSSTPTETLIRQHEAIVAAIDRHDANAAEAAMRTHLSEVLKIAEALAADHPDLIARDA
jgi:DNA-binding GntR family transcriptional regulator